LDLKRRFGLVFGERKSGHPAFPAIFRNIILVGTEIVGIGAEPKTVNVKVFQPVRTTEIIFPKDVDVKAWRQFRAGRIPLTYSAAVKFSSPVVENCLPVGGSDLNRKNLWGKSNPAAAGNLNRGYYTISPPTGSI